MSAVRAGTVTLANAIGNGVIDDKALYPFVPALIRHYMGEQPILPNVQTYHPWNPDQLDHVLGRLDQLVVKPTGESGGHGIVIGSRSTDQEVAESAVLLCAGRGGGFRAGGGGDRRPDARLAGGRGARLGLVGTRPTNLLPAGERHPKIGHGRDHDDVLPLRAVYDGTSSHKLAVEVRMSRGLLTQPVRTTASELLAQHQQQ